MLVDRLFNGVARRMRRFVSNVRTFRDYESYQMHKRLKEQPELLNRDELYSLAVRELGGQAIHCRPATTDIEVFDDTFFGRYHLPPDSIKPVRTVLDLGSNIGLTVAHFAARLPAAKVVGIELDRSNFELCVRNTEPFKSSCRVVHGAVWSTAGTVGYDGNTNWGFAVTETECPERTAQAYTMTQLLDMFPTERVDFVKMDVEGAEGALLENAQEWIGRIRCLKVELHSPWTREWCVDRLREYGMECASDDRHRACVIAFNRP